MFNSKKIALIVLAGLSYSTSCYSKEVSAIKSMDIQPYNEAVKGFREVVEATVSEYVITENSDSLLVMLSKNQKPDLVFTLGTEALRIVKEEIKDTPVVYTFALNPDAIIGGARTNFTGINMNIPPIDLFGSLLQVMPSVERVGVIYDPSKNQSVIYDAETAARNLGLTLVTKKVRTGAEAIAAVNQLDGKIDALWMVPDTTVITPESVEYMLLFSFKTRTPLIGISEKYVKSGALFALAFDSEDIGRQAGEMATRILMGDDAGGVSASKPRKLNLSINMNTAEKLGLKIQDKVLGKASKVYR